jgi:hypothetical protein
MNGRTVVHIVYGETRRFLWNIKQIVWNTVAHMAQEGLNVLNLIFYHEIIYFNLLMDILPILTIFLPQMKCCGVDSYEDFRESKKWTEGNKTVPEACCVLEGNIAKFEPKFKNCPHKPSDTNSYWQKVLWLTLY